MLKNASGIRRFLLRYFSDMHFVIPLINFFGLEIAYLIYPPVIYGAGLVVIGLIIFFILRNKAGDSPHTFALMFSAILLIITHYVFLVFLENAFVAHGFIAFTSLILLALLESIHERPYRELSPSESNYALQNIIGYCNLAVFYFLSVDLFYLDLQTNQKFLLFLVIFTLGSVLLSYSALDIFNLINWRAASFISVIILALGEMFWAAKLLPVSVYSQGAFTTLFYYATLGLSRHYLLFGREELTRKVVSRYLIISLSGFFLIIATSRWS